MSTDALTNAIEALLTPTSPLTAKEATVVQAESDLVDQFETFVDIALAAVPALDFPVEKQIIDAIASITIKIIVDKLDQATFNLITAVQQAKNVSALEAASQAEASDPDAATLAAEEAAANQLIHIGDPST